MSLKAIQKGCSRSKARSQNRYYPKGERSGSLFDSADVRSPMKILAWIRAFQPILFETSVIPASVGVAAAVNAGAKFNASWFGLILISVVAIQGGANLFKGFYEGQDGPQASSGSWIAFDSGATIGLAKEPKTVLRVGYLCFGIGVFAGLVLVLLTSNLLLIAFGLAGALLAWSYSSPPLKLSYHAVGDISTFLAFGPIMTVGATVAFGGAGVGQSFAASIVLGLLAAAISFVRYFPNREEDLSKGKATPVTILGVRTAKRLLYGLFFAPILIGSAWLYFGGGATWILILALIAVLVSLAIPRGDQPSGKYDLAIGLTVAAHLFVGLGLVAHFTLGL